MPRESDTVFAITTGFYPQIASAINYYGKSGRKGTTGSTGGKYAKIRGFSDISVDKQRTYEVTQAEVDASGGMDIKELRERKRRELYEIERSKTLSNVGYEKKDRTLEHPTSQFDEEAQVYRDHYKWIGGSDMYRLYGDQIWYMHGVRRDDVLAKYVDTFGDKTPPFMNIYNRTDHNLVKTAKATANRMFDNAITRAESLIENEMADRYVAASEEIGMEYEFPPGSGILYEYVPYSVALKDDRLKGLLDEKVKGSLANERDLVKVRWNATKTKAVIEKVMDVTEMPLVDPEKAGHGITELPPELVNAIMATKGTKKGELEVLRQAVEKMFIKSIDTEYNPLIQHMKASLEVITGQRVTTMKEFVDYAKNYRDAAAGRGGGNVSKQDIFDSLAIRLAERSTTDNIGVAYNDTAAKYIAHMLNTWGDKVGNDYLQAHRVGDIAGSGGMSLYAFTTMLQYKSGEKVLEFRRNAPKGEENTFIAPGYSATTALEVRAGTMSQAQARVHAMNAKRAFMEQRATAAGTKNRITGARYDVGMGTSNSVNYATQVYAPADAHVSELLEEIMEKGAEAAQEKLEEIDMEGNITGSTYYWNPGQGKKGGKGKRGKMLKKGKGNPSSAGFWALPYIGIMTSEYRDPEQLPERTSSPINRFFESW